LPPADFTDELAYEIAKEGGSGLQMLEAGSLTLLKLWPGWEYMFEGQAFIDPRQPPHILIDDAKFRENFRNGHLMATSSLGHRYAQYSDIGRQLRPDRNYCAWRGGRAWKQQCDMQVLCYETPCNRRMMHAIAGCKDVEAIRCYSVRCIVSAAWGDISILYIIDCVLNVFRLMLLCATSADLRAAKDPETWQAWVLLMLAVKDVLEEFAQFVDIALETLRTAKEFERPTNFFDIDSTQLRLLHLHQFNSSQLPLPNFNFLYHGLGSNIMDVVRLVFDCLGVFLLFNISWEPTADTNLRSPAQEERLVLALWCVLHWLHSLNSFRCFNWFGPKVLPIIYALSASKVFFGVLAFCIAPAVHAYYVLGARQEPGPWLAASIPMFRLAVMGDFDMFELEGTDTVYVEEGGMWNPEDPSPSKLYYPVLLLFFLVSVLVNVTLMNIFIGILSANYDFYDDRGFEMFLQERAATILTYNSRRRLPWYSWYSCLGDRLWTAGSERERDSPLGSSTGLRRKAFCRFAKRCLIVVGKVLWARLRFLPVDAKSASRPQYLAFTKPVDESSEAETSMRTLVKGEMCQLKKENEEMRRLQQETQTKLQNLDEKLTQFIAQCQGTVPSFPFPSPSLRDSAIVR